MKLLKLLPRFRQAYRDLDGLAARETWSRAEVEAFQLERLNHLWRHAVEHVPYYAELRNRQRLPASFQNLEQFSSQVPLLKKQALQHRRLNFLSDQSQRGQWRVTGGSSGTPTFVFRSKAAHLEMLRSRYRFYAMWDVDILDRMVFVWGHCNAHPPGLGGWINKRKIPLEDFLRGRLRLSAYQIEREHARRYLERIALFRPVGIYA